MNCLECKRNSTAEKLAVQLSGAARAYSDSYHLSPTRTATEVLKASHRVQRYAESVTALQISARRCIGINERTLPEVQSPNREEWIGILVPATVFLLVLTIVLLLRG
jgi:hypothetical protein